MSSDAISSATRGVRQNLDLFVTAAAEVASAEGGGNPARIVDMKTAETAVRANLGVISRQADVYDHLIDILI